MRKRVARFTDYRALSSLALCVKQVDRREKVDWTQLLQAIASAATAIGVVFVAVQIGQAKQQAITSFEDDITRQYRDIIQRISVKALLGEELSSKEFEINLNEIYNYIDLTNEQTFLCQQKRISVKTWENWREGIKSNMARPAFEQAWTLIKQKAPESFDELRRLEKSGYRGDPKKWRGNA